LAQQGAGLHRNNGKAVVGDADAEAFSQMIACIETIDGIIRGGAD
jgi:hypothetical protein